MRHTDGLCGIMSSGKTDIVIAGMGGALICEILEKSDFIKNGNIRLKAYNRYNDQNYYIRNALTTQGVGVMFKYDFDNLFHRKKRQPESTDSLPSVPEATIVPGDSIKRLPIKQSSNK